MHQLFRSFSVFLISLTLVLSSPLLAQDGDDASTEAADDSYIEEVITTGTRSAKPRSAADSTVPVDVLSGEDFNAYGGTA